MVKSRKPLFITGIGTDVGKTIVSAVICQQLQADYWKPVQSGDLDHSDSHKIKALVSNPKTKILQEAFRLNLAASPHQSAIQDGIEIFPENFQLPDHQNQLVIEGAGGLFVPLSPWYLMIDLIKQLDVEVVLVARDYLGCINHTLLSIHALTTEDIPLKHLVFNGNFNPSSKEAILRRIPSTSTWSDLPELSEITSMTIAAAPIQIIFNQ